MAVVAWGWWIVQELHAKARKKQPFTALKIISRKGAKTQGKKGKKERNHDILFSAFAPLREIFCGLSIRKRQ